MQWCEDMDMTAILAVWAGHDLSGGSITGDSLDPYVDEILNELEVSIQYLIKYRQWLTTKKVPVG